MTNIPTSVKIMSTERLPIGYWIKQVDDKLTKGIDSIQAQFGLTRTDWQILNVLIEKNTIAKGELIGTMYPFVDERMSNDCLAKLKAERLIDEHNEKLAL